MTSSARREEIEELKRSWLKDPVFELEDADGFEDAREELTAFRLQVVSEREAKEADRLERRAVELGCPGMTGLVAYVETLERRVENLDRQLAEMMEREAEPGPARRF